MFATIRLRICSKLGHSLPVRLVCRTFLKSLSVQACIVDVLLALCKAFGGRTSCKSVIVRGVLGRVLLQQLRVGRALPTRALQLLKHVLRAAHLALVRLARGRASQLRAALTLVLRAGTSASARTPRRRILTMMSAWAGATSRTAVTSPMTNLATAVMTPVTRLLLVRAALPLATGAALAEGLRAWAAGQWTLRARPLAA